MSINGVRVLVVDDDLNIRRTLSVTLKNLGCDVIAVGSTEEATEALRQRPIDFLFTDFRLGARNGLDLLREARLLRPPPVTAVMTAYASYENAVEAIREGAYDYLPKPFSTAQLEHLLRKVRTILDLQRENLRLREGRPSPHYFAGMTSPAMVRLREFITRVSPTDATVLVVGESGTGKSVLARVIHDASARSHGPFVLVSCSNLADPLLESELFGHAKGAFTGAVQERVGKLEAARGGTVFLDEIGDLSLGGQSKLLRFLEEKVIERVGSNQAIPVDARVIAATNRDLSEAMKSGSFREDLYYRLNAFECALVPLRYRKEDLPVLIRKLLKECAVTNHIYREEGLPEAVMECLLTYPWPGNIRDLRNVIERILLLSTGREATVQDLPEWIREPSNPARGQSNSLKTLEELEREHIARVLAYEKHHEKAAEILGITTVTLWRKRKLYGLP